MRAFPGIVPSEILLPAEGVDKTRWAVVACDQYTSQPDYWARVQAFVGGAPSTLHMIYPEIYLSEGDARIPGIHAAMYKALETGALAPAVKCGFTLTERVTESGARVGLVAAADLEAYDYTPGAKSMIRATEGTILSRIPPRVRIREGAPIESPHVMLLIDDPESSIIEPIYAQRGELRALYDFSLMENGGHLRGWAVDGDEDMARLSGALTALLSRADGFLYAVGDGNHSLATAKACWEARKKTLTPAERETHPARYALVEIVNLHSPALLFEPIHRVLFGARAKDIVSAFANWLAARGMRLTEGESMTFIGGGEEEAHVISGADGALPTSILQSFLDEYLAQHADVSIDYVHGEDAVRALCAKPDVVGILLTSIEKSSLFPAIRAGGVLPRKTFSMGEANEKRYYMECRKIL